MHRRSVPESPDGRFFPEREGDSALVNLDIQQPQANLAEQCGSRGADCAVSALSSQSCWRQRVVRHSSGQSATCIKRCAVEPLSSSRVVTPMQVRHHLRLKHQQRRHQRHARVGPWETVHGISGNKNLNACMQDVVKGLRPHFRPWITILRTRYRPLRLEDRGVCAL